MPEGEGLAASRMNGTQREQLMSLIAEYVNQVRGDLARQRLDAIKEQGIDDFHSSWHGGPTRPVAWVLRMESLSQEEKELILWKNLAGLLGF